MADTSSFPPRSATATAWLLLAGALLAAGRVQSAGSARTAPAGAAPESPSGPNDAPAGDDSMESPLVGLAGAAGDRVEASVPVGEPRALAAHENAAYVRITREPNA